MPMSVTIRYACIGVLLLWVLAGCATPEPTAVPSPTVAPTPGPLALTLLYTADGWGYTEPCACDPSVGGLARRAGYIRSVRQQRQNVLVVDSGDSLLTLQRVGDLEQGRLLAEAFDQMGYDAVALGGMDFRMGLDVLREQILVADYAVLSANTLDPQTGDWFDMPYQIVERGGHRIALIGLTDPQIVVEVTGGEVEVTEPVSALMEVVGQVKDDADVIIVLSHLGMVFDINLGQVVPEVDVIVSGKDKEIYDPPLEARGVMIVSAGSRGEYVGRVDLEFDVDGDLVSYESEMRALTEDIADDAAMRQWMAQVGMTPASALKSGSEGQLSQ